MTAPLERAHQLYRVALRLVEQIPDERRSTPHPWDEDWVRDLIRNAEAYTRWLRTGGHDFLWPKQGLSMGKAHALWREAEDVRAGFDALSSEDVPAAFVDAFETAIAIVVRDFEDGCFDQPLDSELASEIESLLADLD